jgi:hypothetical protein
VRHLSKVEGRLDPNAFGSEQSLYTVEGRIDAIGRIGRGLRAASPSQRRFVGRLFAACIAFLVLLAVIMSVVGHFTG